MFEQKNFFYGDMTYDEWASQQKNKMDLEFLAIERGHKSYPGYNLEEIKRDIFTNYIITEDHQGVFQENFGERHVNSKKLNEQISRLIRIIFSSSSEYKSVDKRGHGDTISARIGGRGKDAEVVAFRTEEKAIRYTHYLIEHNMIPGVQTVSDVVRFAFVKYVEAIPIIHEIRDGVTDSFLQDMENERVNLDKRRITALLKGYEEAIGSKEEDVTDAIRHVDNKEELEELKDWTVNFIKNALSYNCATKTEKGRVKDFIMKNSNLYNILTIFEREKLITRDYIDDVRMKGIVPSNLGLISNDDTSFNR